LVDAVKSIPFDSDVEGNYPAHILIFQEESRYARKVLRESCFEMGFPVLPLHDSFIAPRKNVSELEDVMCAASMELYDYVLAHKRKF
jgi:hypothetical protein